jgi:CheY-like chemotaxis protein
MVENAGQILVVDDNGVNRLKLQRVLQSEGHTVVLAPDGEQALAIVRSGEVELVLLDIVMPGMDGYTVLTVLKSDPDCRVRAG